jgi:hypothetical protein
MLPFEYPQDRGELFEGANEEEMAFYFAIMGFEDMINKHGADFVMNRLPLEIVNKIAYTFNVILEEPDWTNENQV